MMFPRAFALACSFALAGCSARAAEMRYVEDGDEVLAQAGPTGAGGWQSAPFFRLPESDLRFPGSDARWIALPGRTAVEIEHALGRRPDLVLVYLSFDEYDREGAGRSAFLGAGDVARISGMSDSDAAQPTITIENTTAADFFLRVVLE